MLPGVRLRVTLSRPARRSGISADGALASVKKSCTMFVVFTRFTVMPASAICSLMISPTPSVSGVRLAYMS